MYVDARYDKFKNEIHVVERINGERLYNVIPANYVLYYADKNGKDKTIYGSPVTKYSTNDHKQFFKEKKILGTRGIFESDINPIFRCLSENYSKCDLPDLHICFLDIETDFNPEKGFSTPWDPFTPITAITVHFNWMDKLITLALKPPTLTLKEAIDIGKDFENTYIFDNEEDLLSAFLDLVEDVDVFSGWNSRGFDLPYIINRVALVLGKEHTKKMCLWNQLPRVETYIKFKKEQQSYDLVGKVHLDYLELFIKHNPQQLHSYKLDYVGEIVVGENKTPYDGTLDKLYRNDFKKFIEYNRQDVIILVKIDREKRYIGLANQMAHDNTVLLKTTMGTVALVEQAIINESHRRGMVVMNRPPRDEEEFADSDDEDEADPVCGAYVADPKVGMHEWIGGVDINSLYPSCIRSLNMGPETLIGQIRPEFTEKLIKDRMASGIDRKFVWDGIFCAVEFQHVIDKTDQILHLDLEGGESIELTGADIHDFVFGSKQFVLSANGTLFKTEVEGIIPGILAKWYSERKTMQAKAKKFAHESEKETDPDLKRDLKQKSIFWDQRQLARKILLNSLYGAILNDKCRFYDARIGQSVTLTGRMIARHMGSKVNEILTENPDYLGKSIIYQDTDSCYFSIEHCKDDDFFKEKYPNLKITKDTIIDLYDTVGEDVNVSFPPFMVETFNTSTEQGSLIKASRELVASKGIFMKKKRYAVLIYDKEGDRKDKNGKLGELKAMGLEIKRSDTPVYMQVFLENLLINVLHKTTEKEAVDTIKKFRDEFRSKTPWEKGTPKKVNGLTSYYQKWNKRQSVGTMFEELKKVSDKKENKVIPGHVMASLYWNMLCKLNGDNYSIPIVDGTKVIVCKLKSNPTGMNSIAYPIDEYQLPDWFKRLPFDEELMEHTIIDMKIGNTFGVLKWDLKRTKNDTTFDELFSMDE